MIHITYVRATTGYMKRMPAEKFELLWNVKSEKNEMKVMV